MLQSIDPTKNFRGFKVAARHLADHYPVCSEIAETAESNGNIRNIAFCCATHPSRANFVGSIGIALDSTPVTISGVTYSQHYRIAGLAVSKRFRRDGIGNDLMRWAISISATYKLPLILAVHRSKTWQWRWFEREHLFENFEHDGKFYRMYRLPAWL